MEYPLWLFFTVWFVSSAIASEEWVQVPIIGHRPKGASEKSAQQSPRISAVQVPLSTRAPTTTTRAPFRPAKVSYRVPPWSPIAPSTPARAPSPSTRAPSPSTRVPSPSTRAPSPSTRAPPTSTRGPSTATRPPPQRVDAPETLSLPELRIEPGLPADEFMRAHETLSRYSKGSVGEKLSFLGHLKKRLLRKTAELMPRAIIALGGRSLAPSAEGRGHKGIGFPSSEGTLMSLAFLVFAVFLVKIVIQLVQGLQSNSYGAVITSTTTRTTRARSNWDKAHTEEELLRLLESLQVPGNSSGYHMPGSVDIDVIIVDHLTSDKKHYYQYLEAHNNTSETCLGTAIKGPGNHVIVPERNQDERSHRYQQVVQNSIVMAFLAVVCFVGMRLK